MKSPKWLLADPRGEISRVFCMVLTSIFGVTPWYHHPIFPCRWNVSIKIPWEYEGWISTSNSISPLCHQENLHEYSTSIPEKDSIHDIFLPWKKGIPMKYLGISRNTDLTAEATGLRGAAPSVSWGGPISASSWWVWLVFISYGQFKTHYHHHHHHHHHHHQYAIVGWWGWLAWLSIWSKVIKWLNWLDAIGQWLNQQDDLDGFNGRSKLISCNGVLRSSVCWATSPHRTILIIPTDPSWISKNIKNTWNKWIIGSIRWISTANMINLTDHPANILHLINWLDSINTGLYPNFATGLKFPSCVRDNNPAQIYGHHFILSFLAIL